MKTKVFTRAIQFSILILMVALTQSCETEIPSEDLTPPEFSFQITGDGFNRTFNQDTDFDSFQLNLKDGARYSYIFSGGDQGGVERIQWFIKGSDYITLLEPVSGPWSLRNSILQDIVEWRGNRSDPLTGSVISGNFRADGGNISMVFGFNVVDFGGESGRRPNRIYKELNLYIGNHPTEIRPF